MNWINVEIKASCNKIEALENILLDLKADYKGEDHQIDTYFNVPEGRLKLREGNIENALIHYHRANNLKPKASKITYYTPSESKSLKNVLTEALGIKVVVDKKRKIFFIDNVKFHLDRVNGLGTFAEIEAIDTNRSLNKDKLQKQCYHYMKLLGILEHDLLATSYSDMLLV